MKKIILICLLIVGCNTEVESEFNIGDCVASNRDNYYEFIDFIFHKENGRTYTVSVNRMGDRFFLYDSNTDSFINNTSRLVPCIYSEHVSKSTSDKLKAVGILDKFLDSWDKYIKPLKKKSTDQ